MAEAKAKKPNFFKKIGKFFSNIISEMKKVTWPSAKTTLNHTGAVAVIVLIAAVVIVLLDLAFGGALDLLIGLIAG
ncbi:MAG: preprotein translocase subunit SecE [Oscillospiraceae bacterium]|nr:preprotein translocase subunit SecE [Oscillospiraceae bacterium]